MNEPSRLIVPAARKQALEPTSEAATLMQVISRAAADPTFDINKMERLMQMHQQIQAQKALEAFSAAMSAAQAEMGPISNDMENSQTKSRYASYAQLDRALRPIYTKHGFALSFNEGDTDKPAHVRVICKVSHSAGHVEPYKKDMPADGKGAKGGDVMTLTHATGAAQAYGMRYLLKGIFNVATGEGDRDGNTEECIGPGQAADIRALLSEVNAKEDSFLRTIKAKSIEEIHVGAYKTVIGILEAKRKSK
ncbi:MAG TPA: ERF family protein, partial [Bryobacteraceae bacterium]|nr:ERF family protein [Bryobacteraceae bacterium]